MNFNDSVPDFTWRKKTTGLKAKKRDWIPTDLEYLGREGEIVKGNRIMGGVQNVLVGTAAVLTLAL